jgi:hypothetical protein
VQALRRTGREAVQADELVDLGPLQRQQVRRFQAQPRHVGAPQQALQQTVGGRELGALRRRIEVGAICIATVRRLVRGPHPDLACAHTPRRPVDLAVAARLDQKQEVRLSA